MSSKSDNNNKPRTNIFELLPEVYRSNLNEALLEDSFNRHLTKDDLARVSGFIGLKNPQALVDRQIKEPTPYRQAFQLQPTMYTKVGSTDHVLTQPGFFKQLELMGVDINRLPQWANTLQFNWVPPVNIDMLVNYYDYYWPVTEENGPPQYLTIENRCNKARSKAESYQTTIERIGDIHTIVSINPGTRQFIIEGDYAFLFTEGFVFFTKNTSNVNYADTFWTVSSSTYDTDTNQLTITVQEDIAIESTTAPVTTTIGRWWWKTDTEELFVWTGFVWAPTAVFVSGDISLSELLAVFQRDANCVCNEDYGWDLAPWDDNQVGDIVWNTSLLTAISHPTEADWITANGAPNALDLWFDTTEDKLKQRDPTNTSWITVVNSFSTILTFTTGRARWDNTVDCIAQEFNQWSEQNKWIHKSQVSSFGGVKRAQVPIIEYNSWVEQNEWSKTVFSWKYRASVDNTFETSSTSPKRVELEPIKDYAAVLDGGKWYLYLFTKTATMNRDIDHTDFFTPGTKFRIVDDAVLSEVYTVARAEFRRIEILTDPVNTILFPDVLTGYFATVVELEEAVFTAPTTGGTVVNIRIEPQKTSKGDPWRGYHVHWVLDPNVTYTEATAPRLQNPVLLDSLAATNPIVPLVDGLLEIGTAHQEFTATVAGVTLVALDSSFLYTPSESRFYATPNSNELRVYRNGIRQYGTYTELTATGSPNYTLVGTNPTTTAPITYVTGIQFTLPLNQYDVIRMEVAPASVDDMGTFAVPVRTVEDEAAFALEVIAGTQPVYMSLTTYQKLEQVKTQTNQYPYFNVYDICTDEVVNASPLFAFKEDSSYPINANVGRRIVSTTDGRDYTFIQYLLDRDDNILYGYRNLGKAPDAETFWYSPYMGTVKFWGGDTYGDAWSDQALVPAVTLNNTSGLTVRTPVISETEPTELLDVDAALWLNPTTQVLYKRSTLGASWTAVPDLIISDADPILETVWKNGNNHEYVPQYVNSDREPVTVGDPSGDWELLDQWFYNSEHKNKSEANYTQLVTHFRSVIDEQPDVPGLPSGGMFSLTQNEYDYGVGGTIKEHNNSFDTLISAVNVTNVTPVGLMEWAEDQYTLGLLFVRDFYNTDIVRLYSDYSKESLVQQAQTISSDIIEQFKLNDFLSLVYGDTTAYNVNTDVGMPNWIATTPIMLLSNKYRPHLLVDDDLVELYHHDGHRTRITYTAGEIDRYARQLVAVDDPRVTNGKLGVQSNLTPPSTEAAFWAAFGGTEVRTGVYWYRLVGGIQTLYRFVAYDVSTVDPSFFLNGVELPDGTRYYNISTNEVRIKSGLSWVVETSGGNISSLWQEVVFAEDFGQILLNVEQRLYDAVPTANDLVFDYSTLNTEPTVYNAEYEKRFYAFVAERNIKAPLVNTTYSATNAFSWNYINSLITLPPRLDITPSMAACWQELYTRWYGTPYPHLEPWKLQGFNDKPTWWDEEYLNTTGGRRWIYNHGTSTGMWENIRVGRIPVGRTAPDGSPGTGLAGQVLITYNYFSVNISDTAITGGYQPDDLLPPYYDATGAPLFVRSLFANFLSEISSPDADYVFGDVGPVEWQWTVSSEYVYDIPIIAFIMQPARFLHYAFGIEFIDVDKLQVETTFCQPYSHEDVLFHGDVYNTNLTFVANGLNQWYVNFNRFSGYDTNAEFRQLWAGWDPKQSYAFAGIIDTSTFDIDTKYFDVVNEDYQVVLANTGVFKDLWAEGFEVSVLSIPPAIIQYNNQAAWKFDLDSLASIDRELTVYGVKQYPFVVDITTDECTMYRYRVADASAPSKRFFVTGNQTLVFQPGTQFTVQNSTSNDGTYTVVSSVYELSSSRTRINVVEVVPSSVGDGEIDVSGFVMPWTTGQEVVITSSRNLPAPLVPGVPYYIIATGPKTFQLAETFNDAISNVPIDFVTLGDGEILVGEVASSFQVFGGASNSKEIWYHFVLDKDQLITFTPPTSIAGMQSLINVLDGYAQYQMDTGIMYSQADGIEFDEETGRTINWQFEIERFIDWAYNLRRSRLNIADRYDFSLNGSAPTQELVFGSGQPVWQNGRAIVFGTTGSLPAPLVAGAVYYFVNTSTPGVFKVSITSNTAVVANHITFTTAGSGTLYVSQFQPRTAFPSFEINPTRNNVWIDTPQGLLSNVITGPYSDIRVNQTIFDQHGNTLTADKLNIYRQDLQSRIAMRPQVPDPQNLIPDVLKTQYDYLHLGGGHFFVEGYEHILLFNDYTVGGALVYDQFFGLWASKFNLDYYEKENYTLRPTLGGHYLIGGQFFRNIEGTTVDVHNYYDTYDLREGTTQARYARNLVGYQGTQNYLDLVNMNDKSQFLFYRGMIQYKGSVAGARAYINSRRFVDAKIDEFWAWKIAEFGDSRPRVYPQVKLLSTDAIQQDVMLHFLGTTETLNDTDVVQAVADGFKPIEWTDQTRWEIYPEQKVEIETPLFLDAEVSSMWKLYVGTVTPTAGQSTVDYWYDTGTAEFKQWDGTTWNVVTNVPLSIVQDGTVMYVRVDQPCDDMRVIRRKLNVAGDLREYETVIYVPGGGVEEYQRLNSEVMKFQTAGFADVMVLFTINPGFSKISPSKLIDKKSNTVVTNAQLWDPARGHHSSKAIHNVDLQNTNDPAQYLVTLNPNLSSKDVWAAQHAERIWLDTSMLGYKMYYDDKLYPDVNDRLNNWGTLADWASVNVYEWTASTVAPEDWAETGERQVNDILRPQRSKATGTVRQTLFKRTRESYTAEIVDITGGYHTVDLGGTAVPLGATGIVADDSAGYQDVLMSGTPVPVNPTGLAGTAPFQANIFVDGNGYLISVTAVSASTYGALLTQLNAQLLGSATASIVGNSIRITSASTGLGSTIVVQDVNLFGSLNLAPAIVQAPVNGSNGTTYTATVVIDGTSYNLALNGDDATTFTDLIAAINVQLGSAGAAALDSGNLQIVSATYGTASTVQITVPGTLFTSLFGYLGLLVPVAGQFGKVKVPVGLFSVDDTVLFTTTDTFPTPITEGTKYIVSAVSTYVPDPLNYEVLDLEDVGTNTSVDIVTAGVGTLSIVPAFKTTAWIRSPFLRERQYGAVDFTTPSVFEPLIVLNNPNFAEYDKVDVYINDRLIVPSYQLSGALTVSLTGTGVTVYEQDIVDIIRPLRVLTNQEQTFDPDVEDDGSTMVQWKYDYEYTTATTFDGNTAVTTYYFWVQNSQYRDPTDNTSLSAFEVAQQLESIPTPYFTVHAPKDDPVLVAKYGYGLIPYGSVWSLPALAEQFLIVPVLYRQAVLRKASNYLTEDNRFVWRFTRDLTLRYTMKGRNDLKTKHEEWFMFRREQPSTIPRELWDRLTEALMGYTLTDSSVRVPLLDRELYDALYGTDTRFGLGEGQAFCDKNYALASVIAYLEDPNNDFTPIDIDDFFANYSFDTPENIRIAMDRIYETFNTQDVNNIWFETLQDALSTRAKYKELLKTSWIALHGIRVLEVGGLFDD